MGSVPFDSLDVFLFCLNHSGAGVGLHISASIADHCATDPIYSLVIPPVASLLWLVCRSETFRRYSLRMIAGRLGVGFVGWRCQFAPVSVSVHFWQSSILVGKLRSVVDYWQGSLAGPRLLRVLPGSFGTRRCPGRRPSPCYRIEWLSQFLFR